MDQYKVYVRNAIKNVSAGCVDSYRWALVRDLFCIGAGYAMSLCREFGFDPDEIVKSDFQTWLKEGCDVLQNIDD